ncbi:unnamed protein product, partial [Rotaria sp. Silwood1]
MNSYNVRLDINGQFSDLSSTIESISSQDSNILLYIISDDISSSESSPS